MVIASALRWWCASLKGALRLESVGHATFIARLYRLGKLELREKELLSDREVIEALCNSRKLGGVTIRKQEAYDPSQINALGNSTVSFWKESRH